MVTNIGSHESHPVELYGRRAGLTAGLERTSPSEQFSFDRVESEVMTEQQPGSPEPREATQRQRNQSSRNYLSKTWMWEFLCCFLVAGSLLGLVATIGYHQ